MSASSDLSGMKPTVLSTDVTKPVPYSAASILMGTDSCSDLRNIAADWRNPRNGKLYAWVERTALIWCPQAVRMSSCW